MIPTDLKVFASNKAYIFNKIPVFVQIIGPVVVNFATDSLPKLSKDFSVFWVALKRAD